MTEAWSPHLIPREGSSSETPQPWCLSMPGARSAPSIAQSSSFRADHEHSRLASFRSKFEEALQKVRQEEARDNTARDTHDGESCAQNDYIRFVLLSTLPFDPHLCYRFDWVSDEFRIWVIQILQVSWIENGPLAAERVVRNQKLMVFCRCSARDVLDRCLLGDMTNETDVQDPDKPTSIALRS